MPNKHSRRQEVRCEDRSEVGIRIANPIGRGLRQLTMNRLAAVGIALGVASSGFGALNSAPFAGETDFRAVLVGDPYTEHFDGIDYGDLGTGTWETGNGLQAAVLSAGAGNLLCGADAVQSNYLTTALEAGMRIDFTAGSPTAVGGRFFCVSETDGLFAATLDFEFSDGTDLSFAVGDLSDGLFRGFLATDLVPLAWMRVSTSTTGAYVGLDDLTVGYAAIPEPSTCAGLLGLGALVGAFILRRRKLLSGSS